MVTSDCDYCKMTTLINIVKLERNQIERNVERASGEEEQNEVKVCAQYKTHNNLAIHLNHPK